MDVFELLETLGRGSYGSVYKARNRQSSEIVAVKVISLDEGEESVDPIRKEIFFLRECRHPNIVNYFNTYFRDDSLWVSVLDLFCLERECMYLSLSTFVICLLREYMLSCGSKRESHCISCCFSFPQSERMCRCLLETYIVRSLTYKCNFCF